MPRGVPVSVRLTAPPARQRSIRGGGSLGADGDTQQRDSFSLTVHLLAIAVVVLLFGSLFGPLGGMATVATAVVVVGLAIIRSLARHGAMASRTILLAVVLVAVVAVRAYYDPPSTDYGHTKWLNFCTLTFATMAAAAAVTSRRNLRTLAMWWVFAGTVLAVLAVVGPAAATGRAQVNDSNPVWLGRAIASSVVITLWLCVNRTWRWWRFVLLLPILVAGLLATGSRGPALAAAVGMVVLLVAPTARRSKQLLWLVGAMIGLPLTAPTLPGVADSRLEEFLTEGNVNSESRTQLWTTAIHLIPDFPLGVGIGNWATVTGSQFDWPHNLFLEVFVEQGWAAGIGISVLVFVVFRRLWVRSGAEPGLQLALALLATETIHVSTSGDLNARTFFFVLLLGVALLHKQRFAPEGVDKPLSALATPHNSSAQRSRHPKSVASRSAIARRD